MGDFSYSSSIEGSGLICIVHSVSMHALLSNKLVGL